MDTHEPNILYIDIETTPMLVYTWGMWKQNALDVKEESRILGYAYAWGDAKVKWVDCWHGDDYHAKIEALWRLFDKADWIVAHNGDRFDIKRINLEFAREGLTPPSFYETIDTKKIAAKAFGNYSNSLKYLARTFQLDEKMQNSGFRLWLNYMADIVSARREMSLYARQDVDTMRQLYYHVRPWATTHPNMGHYRLEMACRVCGSTGLRVVKYKRKRTRAGVYPQYQCQDCGAYSTSPHRVDSPELR